MPGRNVEIGRGLRKGMNPRTAIKAIRSVLKEEDSSVVAERVVTRRTMLHVAMLHLGGLTVADTAARAEEGHTTLRVRNSCARVEIVETNF